jgi:hypothetical protein
MRTTDLTDDVLSRLELRIAELEYGIAVDDVVMLSEVLALSELYDTYNSLVAEIDEAVSHE